MTKLSRRSTVPALALAAAAAALGVATPAPAGSTPIPKPMLVFAEHTNSVNGVALAADGRTAVTASSDKTIRFWDMMSGARTNIIRHTDPLNAVAISPDGRTLAVGDRSPAIVLFDVATRQELKRLPKPDGPVMWMAFSPDGRSLATLGYHAGEAAIWDIAGGTKRLALKHRNASINNVAFSADSKRLATSGTDEVVRFWDAGDGSPIAVGKGHDQEVHFVAFAPDGKTAVSAGQDKTLKVWDAQTGKCLSTLEGHTGPVRWVGFTPDGRSILSLSLNDAQIKVWEPRKEQPNGGFQWFRGAVSVPNYNSNLALSADGRKLLIGRNAEAALFDLSPWLPTE
jgi:WD40 repeat protein